MGPEEPQQLFSFLTQPAQEYSPSNCQLCEMLIFCNLTSKAKFLQVPIYLPWSQPPTKSKPHRLNSLCLHTQIPSLATSLLTSFSWTHPSVHLNITDHFSCLVPFIVLRPHQPVLTKLNLPMWKIWNWPWFEIETFHTVNNENI